MKQLLPSTHSGQVLILLALAGIGLFGIVGLAIDGSAKFSDRRHAQNAADTAALAAALAIARVDPDWELEALDRALENGYDDNPLDEVEVHSPPASGIYSNCSDVHFDCNDYVQVIITSRVNTLFARVVGIHQMQNRVEAVASTISSYEGNLFGGSAVVALSPSGCSLVAGGTANTNVIGGGLYSNSDSSDCAFKQNGCSGEINVYQEDGVTEGAITSVGNMKVNTNCDELISATLNPGGEKQQPFPPLFSIPEPTACSTNGSKTTSGGVTTLTPGRFNTLPPSGSAANVVLTPGIYCVERQIKTTGSETLTLQGTFGTDPGVFIYIKAGGSQNPISLQGGDVQLWADSSGDYAHYLIYVAPNYATGTPVNCTINGTSGQMLKGTIYAPFCNIKVNGSSAGGFQSQLIGYTVDLSGNAAVTIYYDADETPFVTIPSQISLSK